MYKMVAAVLLLATAVGCSGGADQIRPDNVTQGASPGMQCGVWCPGSSASDPEYFCELPDGGGVSFPDGGLNLFKVPGACRISTTECATGEVRCDGNPPTALCCLTEATP